MDNQKRRIIAYMDRTRQALTATKDYIPELDARISDDGGGYVIVYDLPPEGDGQVPVNDIVQGDMWIVARIMEKCGISAGGDTWIMDGDPKVENNQFRAKFRLNRDIDESDINFGPMPDSDELNLAAAGTSNQPV